MGYPPDEVGLLLLPFPLTMLFVAPAAGWLSDHVSPSVLGVAGMAVAVARAGVHCSACRTMLGR